MRLFLTAIICFLSLQLWLPAPVRGNDGERLLKIVALSRHGVRAPTQTDKTLSTWSQKTWPVWPVEKGYLTPRGEALATAMWENLRIRLASYGILPENACPTEGSIYVRADVDERTRMTARGILDGLAKGCGIGYAVLPDAKVDPLFHPVKAGLYHFNPILTATDILAMTDGGLGALQGELTGGMALISEITGPPAPALCARFTMVPDCVLTDLPNAISISPDGDDVRLAGALSIASSLAEIFLLEYAEWPGQRAGWGQVGSKILAQILPVHAKVFDVVNRAQMVAWAKGSSLLTEMTAALLNRHSDPRLNEAKLAIFVGHDTNIANIGALLNLDWQASGYPVNGIPPAGALFFELWENNGKKEIRTRFYAQPPEVLHTAFHNGGNPEINGDNAPGFAPVSVTVSHPPVVGEARFDVEEFDRLVLESTEGAPLAPVCHPPLVDAES